MSAGLVSARVNTRESGNGVSVGKPGHIPELRHELRAKRIAYAVHGHDDGIFRELRRALFLVMDCLLKTQPQDDPVYRFMDKKRAEGKPYLVYMTAGANKFLRIYYGRVKEYLASLEGN